MSETTCLHCTATTSNGLALCARDQRTLMESFVNVAAYFTDVDNIKPGHRVKVRSTYRSTPPPETSPTFDKASDLLDHVATIVFGWGRNLEDDRPQVTKMPSTTELRCAWLEIHIPTIVTLEWAAECLREMLDCERRLRRMLDQADTGHFAGVCENEIGRETTDDGDVLSLLCQRSLYVAQDVSFVRCPECGRTWDATERRQVMLNQARATLAPVSVAARAVVGLLDEEPSVERLANRIDQWVKRGRLHDVGVRVLADGKPHRVYRLGDVFDLLGVPKPEGETNPAEAC